MALRVRILSDEEVATIQRLAHSRTEPARTVERARIVWLAHQGRRVPAIARELRLSPVTVRSWLKRFNRRGVAGLQEAPRPGRPAIYTPEQVSEVIATSLTDPTTLGLPFASWTLDRLAAYLQEVKGITIKRTRINELLLAEGLRWRTQETWFGERVDPAFAEKRGSSRRSTRLHRRLVS
jgi:transposase